MPDGPVWLCGCTCVYMCASVRVYAETRAHKNQMWHMHRHTHTNALRCDSINYIQHVLFPQKPGALFLNFSGKCQFVWGEFTYFLREKGNNISSTLASELILEERARDAVYTPVCGSFVKICWPIIFVNQPVSLPTTPGSAQQHIHAFMKKKGRPYWKLLLTYFQPKTKLMLAKNNIIRHVWDKCRDLSFINQ